MPSPAVSLISGLDCTMQTQIFLMHSYNLEASIKICKKIGRKSNKIETAQYPFRAVNKIFNAWSYEGLVADP